MKYIEWLNIWLNNYIKPSAKERTYIRYEQLIRTHIAPKIGGNDINDLMPIVLKYIKNYRKNILFFRNFPKF